jgi:DNA-binding YbaB/EbfC family protein
MNTFKKTQKLMEEVSAMHESLDNTEVTGEAGAGAVKVTISCNNAVRRVKIDKSLVVADEVDVLEDLVAAAMSDAIMKASAVVVSRQEELYSRLPQISDLSS